MPRRHWRCAYSNSGGWPWMYVQQPRGWAEQSWSMGYGQRPQHGDHHHHSHYPSQYLCAAPQQNALNIDALSALFTRLILQSYLTQLSGDAHGCRSGGGSGGGALWGCNIPGAVSVSSHTQSCHTHHACAGSGSGANSTGNNVNRNSMCHTCPAATRPYMGPNNVFVIPSGYVHCGSGGGGIGNGGRGPANIDPNNNNNNNTLNMLLNGLGLGCGREQGMNCSAPATAGSCSIYDVGHGPPNNHNASSGFHCDQCNFHMVY